MDSRLYKSVMSRFATGVTVLTFRADGVAAGMTANAFMSVSINPPLILASIRDTSRFNRHVPLGTRYGINVLGDHQKQLISHFGGRASTELVLRFADYEGVPLLDESLAQMVVNVVDIHP